MSKTKHWLAKIIKLAKELWVSKFHPQLKPDWITKPEWFKILTTNSK